jgi:hypothetical protein
MQTFLQDLQYAIRTPARNPGLVAARSHGSGQSRWSGRDAERTGIDLRGVVFTVPCVLHAAGALLHGSPGQSRRV